MGPSEMTVLVERLGIKTTAATQFLVHSLENTLLMDKKQLDYGPGNIAKFGEFGCVVRMNDKIERIANLAKSQAVSGTVVTTMTPPQNEPLEDSYRDIANYALIALMVHKGEWPKV
jgi:hypothetical protein